MRRARTPPRLTTPRPGDPRTVRPTRLLPTRPATLPDTGHDQAPTDPGTSAVPPRQASSRHLRRRSGMALYGQAGDREGLTGLVARHDLSGDRRVTTPTRTGRHRP